MIPATLTALQASIDVKWQAIVDGTGEDLGYDNCALCDRFTEFDYYDDEGRSRSRMCAEPNTGEICPVAIASGQDGCKGTPYIEWAGLFRKPGSRIADTPERKAAAQAELSFLQSLLPNEGAAMNEPHDTLEAIWADVIALVGVENRKLIMLCAEQTFHAGRTAGLHEAGDMVAGILPVEAKP